MGHVLPQVERGYRTWKIRIRRSERKSFMAASFGQCRVLINSFLDLRITKRLTRIQGTRSTVDRTHLKISAALGDDGDSRRVTCTSRPVRTSMLPHAARIISSRNFQPLSGIGLNGIIAGMPSWMRCSMGWPSSFPRSAAN